MINPGRSYNIEDYKEIFLRRRLYFIVPLSAIFLCACLWCAIAPRKYEASTLVLVIPQRVPSELVRSTVTTGITERLNAISQEIMSRTRLEAVIDEMKLFPNESKTVDRDALVAMVRSNITVDISRRAPGPETGGYFSIKYTSKDPQVAAAVANRLSSLFIEENLKQREQQAVGTTEFLASELAVTKEKLEKQGQILSEYKRRHMGSLPEQRDTNIRLLEQLQQLYQRNEESLRAAEDRKLLIRTQMSDIESPPAVVMGPSGTSQPGRTPGSYEAQTEELKRQLADLQSRYTEKHPDIVRTRKRIADLEKSREATSVRNDPRYRELSNSLAALDMEIKRLRDDGEKLRGQMGMYRGRIEGATVREQEMSTVVQEYNNTKLVYDTLIKKSEEAQQAENLERRQKGEQFRVVDSARVPENPVQPNIPKVLLIGLFGGIACGLGGIFLREQLDRSFRDPEDVEATLGFKVLANIPKIISKAS
jgi:polysaccharide chain length determinant protein (PEP-CTERM system associated)